MESIRLVHRDEALMTGMEVEEFDPSVRDGKGELECRLAVDVDDAGRGADREEGEDWVDGECGDFASDAETVEMTISVE